MKNILVATDLTERSDRALGRAALLSQQLGAMLHIVHVVDDEVSSVVARAVEKNASTELRRIVSDDPAFKGIKTEVHVEFGDAWKRIIELTSELKADLVVLGAHRNRGIRELFHGTTLHRIAKASSAPMLIAVDRALEPYKNAMVGVDFSDCARNAVDLAATISEEHALTLVHAYHVPFKGLTTHMDLEGDISMREKSRIEAELSVQMDAFLEQFPANVLTSEVVMVEGGPITVLATEARNRKSDLICVGTHAKPWLVGTLLGSTASELLSYPPCDVLIAPHKNQNTN